jgi:hypothetical protein
MEQEVFIIEITKTYGKAEWHDDIKKMLKQKKVEKKLFAEVDAAPQTYKKIGVFTDLDRKYEIDGADPNGGNGEPQSDGGGGGGGGSVLGGGGDMEPMGGGDDMEMDSSPMPTPTPDAGGGTSGGGAADMALGESRKRKMTQEEIDDMYIKELLGDFEEEEKVPSERLPILEKGKEVMNKADKLFKSLEGKFKTSNVLTEIDGTQHTSDVVFVESSENPLLGNYNSFTQGILEMMNEIQKNYVDEEIIPVDDDDKEEESKP